MIPTPGKKALVKQVAENTKTRERERERERELRFSVPQILDCGKVVQYVCALC